MNCISVSKHKPGTGKMNPNVQKPVNEILSDVENIDLIAPLPYEAFLWLMENDVVTWLKKEKQTRYLLTLKMRERSLILQEGLVRRIICQEKNLIGK